MLLNATEVLKRPTALSLIIANTLPLFGVLFFGWSLFSVMFLYWFESAVVGFYSILKLAKVGKWLSLFLVPFFCVHFGGFMLIHLVFLVVLFSGKVASEDFSPLILINSTFCEVLVPAVALFISHGHSYRSNFLAMDEFSRSTVEKLMQAPYKRVIIMHLTIVLGGFLILPLGQPIAGLVLLIVLKTVSDLTGHVREREAFKKINY